MLRYRVISLLAFGIVPALASDLVTFGQRAGVAPRLMASILTLESCHGTTFGASKSHSDLDQATRTVAPTPRSQLTRTRLKDSSFPPARRVFQRSIAAMVGQSTRRDAGSPLNIPHTVMGEKTAHRLQPAKPPDEQSPGFYRHKGATPRRD